LSSFLFIIFLSSCFESGIQHDEPVFLRLPSPLPLTLPCRHLISAFWCPLDIRLKRPRLPPWSQRCRLEDLGFIIDQVGSFNDDKSYRHLNRKVMMTEYSYDFYYLKVNPLSFG